MTFSKNGDTSDPHRRRVDAEQFAAREQSIWALHRQGHSVRPIARELGCPRSTVHRAVQKLTKMQQAIQHDDTDALIEAVGGVDRDGQPLAPELVELYRRAWHELEYGTVEQQAALREFHEAVNAYWAARGRPVQVGGRVDDGHGWREGVDRAMSGDSGVDGDDW